MLDFRLCSSLFTCFVGGVLAFPVGAAETSEKPTSRLAQNRPSPTSRPVQRVPVTVPGHRSHVPMIIAHRGASGTLPEHTIAAYKLAIKQGADAIEPDLVSTKDGVLIVRHENELSGTTDVAKKFPTRKRTKVIDGKRVTGWFSEDFTLADIRTLRATQRLRFRNQSHNGKWGIPTFREVLQLVQKHNSARKRKLVIVPELKHPSYFQQIKLPLEPRFLKLLRAFKLDYAGAPVVVQSFEVSNLKWLRKRTKVRLLQLLGAPQMRPYDFVLAKDKRTYGDMMTDKGLKEVATYADAIGPWKFLIWTPPTYRKMLKTDGMLVPLAHKHNLQVFAYTFRDESRYLVKRFQSSPKAEYHFFFDYGIQGIFTDFPASARKAAASYRPPYMRLQKK